MIYVYFIFFFFLKKLEVITPGILFIYSTVYCIGIKYEMNLYILIILYFNFSILYSSFRHASYKCFNRLISCLNISLFNSTSMNKCFIDLTFSILYLMIWIFNDLISLISLFILLLHNFYVSIISYFNFSISFYIFSSFSSFFFNNLSFLKFSFMKLEILFICFLFLS